MPDTVTIVVADDDPQVRAFVRKVLENRGYVIIEAPDGAAALDEIRAHGPHLILLDVHMPELDGFAVCQALRDDPALQDIPVAMMTGASADIEHAIQGLRAGAAEYLYKPFDVETLLACVQSTLPDTVVSRAARILIVDDSAVNLQVMEGYLHQTGYRIQTAMDGETGLEMARQDPPDVILLDVQMPGMNGFEVCQHLKKDSRTQAIPVMFVTANALDDDAMLRGYNLGAVDYLRKPFLRDELLARLQVMVRLRQQQSDLERQVFTDPLTELPNRRLVLDRLNEEFSRARRHSFELSAMMLDIDHFKRVNDTYGHDAGDHVLREVGALIAALVRNEDVVGRYGGEEFAFILPLTGLEAAQVLAQRIRRSVGALEIEYEGQAIHITVSMGVATYPDLPILNPRELLRYADEALYAAKAAGRNRVEAQRTAASTPES